MRQTNGTVLLRWPLIQHIITAGWRYSDGTSHSALDLRAAIGTPVYAAEAGTVDWVQAWDGHTKTGNQSYGNLVRILHQPYRGAKLQTYYAHLSQTLVKQGEAVAEGQLIGYAGNTGNSFGSHLHFEVRLNGTRVNPLNWLDDDFTTASNKVILGDYTSVEAPEKEKEESNMNFTSDTLKIGPVSEGDRNTLKELAAQLALSCQDLGDDLIVGPMSAGDRTTVAAKVAALALECADYTPSQKPQEETPGPARTDLSLVLEKLEGQEKTLEELSLGMTLLLDKLAAAGKALG